MYVNYSRNSHQVVTGLLLRVTSSLTHLGKPLLKDPTNPSIMTRTSIDQPVTPTAAATIRIDIQQSSHNMLYLTVMTKSEMSSLMVK